jgi:hypothetical protein
MLLGVEVDLVRHRFEIFVPFFGSLGFYNVGSISLYRGAPISNFSNGSITPLIRIENSLFANPLRF